MNILFLLALLFFVFTVCLSLKSSIDAYIISISITIFFTGCLSLKPSSDAYLTPISFAITLSLPQEPYTYVMLFRLALVMLFSVSPLWEKGLTVLP